MDAQTQVLYFNSLATLLDQQIPIIDSLEVAKGEFPRYEIEIGKVRKPIREGKSLSDNLDSLKVPDFVTSLVRTGEATGRLPSVFRIASDLISKAQQHGYPSDELLYFTCLAEYIDGGVPLMPALQSLSEYVPFPPRDITIDICGKLETGSTFRQAIEDHDKYFSAFTKEMIDAGQRQGILDVTLQKIAQYQMLKHTT